MKTTKLEIKRLGINGEGIGYINKKITFVRGTIPKEEVEIEIVDETANYKTGKLVKVVKPSKSRVKAPCFQVEHCLGCPIMHLNYEEQLYFKRDIIRDSLRKYTDIDITRFEFRKTVPATKLEGYKNTVHLPIVCFNHKVTFGIYQRESKYLTVMTNCLMHHPLINQCLCDLEEIFQETNAKEYDEIHRKGLRFITIRVFNDKLQIVFVTGRDGLNDKLVERISKLEYIESIYYTINTNKGQDFTFGRYHKMFGKTKQEFRLKSNKFIISPKSDYCLNPAMVEPIIDIVNQLIGDRELSILEVNGGIGWLSLNLPDTVTVKGVEYHKEHINDAMVNARFLRKEQCSYEFGKVDEIIPTLTKHKNFDMFIVHAPKLGMRKLVIESLIKGKVKELIYISSSPSSFAKDVADLQKYYTLDVVVPIDQMPNTQNVVVVAKLKQRDKKRR